jgi:hypothetical protein
MEEKLFVKEKLVLLVVEIAKREWPQRWSGMLEQLTQIAQLGVRLLYLEFIISNMIETYDEEYYLEDNECFHLFSLLNGNRRRSASWCSWPCALLRTRLNCMETI